MLELFQRHVTLFSCTSRRSADYAPQKLPPRYFCRAIQSFITKGGGPSSPKSIQIAFA